MTREEKNKLLSLRTTLMEVNTCSGCSKIWRISDRMQIRDGIIQHVRSKHPKLFE